MTKLNRRSFLHGVGSATVVGSLSGLMPSAVRAVVGGVSPGAHPDLLAKRGGDIKYHSCLRNCADRCLMKFSVQGGRMTYVTGANEQSKTGTAPCVKGLAYVQYTYAPDRILHPMERVGPKGSGQWRRITWDQAYDKITTKLKSLVDEFGPESIMPYSYSGNYGAIGMRGGPDRFFNRLGSTVLDRLVCTEAGSEALHITNGTFEGPDPETIPDTDCYISWGFNETVSNVHGIKLINQARDRGAKVLAVNPYRTPICSQADVWLQPKPATDAWLATGVMKILLENKWTDNDFIQKHVAGYDALLARVNEVSMDDIERVTGVSRKKIFEFAKIYAGAEKCMMRVGYGFQRNYNGGRMVRAVALMHAMRGQYGKHASGLIFDNVAPITGMNLNIGRGNYLRKGEAQHVNMTELASALRAENPMSSGKKIKPIKCVICYNGNPLAVAPNINEVQKNFMRDDLFVVGFDMVMTDTMEYADIILPASTQFETDDVIGDYHSWYIQICEKVIEPVGESKPNWTFFSELAKRMGYTDAAFNDTPLDISRQLLTSDKPHFKGVSFERLQKEKFIRPPMTDPMAEPTYATKSGKIEAYSQTFKDHGFHPVIDLGLVEEEMIDKERQLPFRLLTPGIPQRVNSSFYNVEYIRAFNAYACLINPADAKKLGIKTNDRVRLSNHRGEAKFVAHVTHAVGPGTLHTAKCNWRRMNPYGKEGNSNSLTTEKLADLGGCSAYHSTQVAIEKA